MLGVCLLCQCQLQTSIQICHDCELLLVNLVQAYENPHPEFSKLWQRFHSVGLYQPPLDSLLRRGKYKQDFAVLKSLAVLLAKSLRATYFEQNATVIPVPMGQSRFLSRGFNQAAIIANHVAKLLGMPYAPNLVRNTGKSAVQHQLNKQQRLRNMRGTFEVIKPVSKSICIVDDVYTTGATVQELARELRRAGCEYIEIWIIAKTL